ncbi:MAG: hypothetical protein ACSHXH_18910, partial [Marivita sp.]|uniref:hypothetical protein n=1 Tax=Marivita sp. TaxID=2003365 RepID=UPI003EF6DBB9
MNTQIIDAGRNASGGYKVDVSRGENVDRVSSEWFSRPGPVAVWCRSFDSIMCSKGDELWVR